MNTFNAIINVGMAILCVLVATVIAVPLMIFKMANSLADAKLKDWEWEKY